MTSKTIDMAREAGFEVGKVFVDGVLTDAATRELKAFEALVRADEREVCAKVCDELADILACHNDRDGADICVNLRDTIRAKGETQ